MSTTLFFLIPIGMLAVVWSLCFVGCVFHTGGLPDPYTNQILSTTGLLAYWPLSDFPGGVLPPGAPPLPPTPQGSQNIGPAADFSGNNHNGSYLIPPAYPAGTTTAAIIAPTPATGLALRQTSIVIGDVTKGGTIDKNLAACVDFEGGYVNIVWAANSPSLTDFTLEAWIKPKWTAATSGFNWVLFDAQTATTGFGLYIDTNNMWVLSVGDGTTIQTMSTMVPAAINGVLTYVAMTFDSKSQALSLWINPVSQESDIPSQPAIPPSPVWPPPGSPPTTYAASDPTQPATFFIGAGVTQLPLRMQAGTANTAPLFPFQGLIQDVALYNVVLDPTTLASHFANGSSAT